jgi:hypothetical protein
MFTQRGRENLMARAAHVVMTQGDKEFKMKLKFNYFVLDLCVCDFICRGTTSDAIKHNKY